jgi:hypothetical protein
MKKELTNQFLERKDRLIHEHVHDPYRTKPRTPAVCPICFAVFRGGRWQWAAWWSINAHHQICPACHRTRDNYPAGTVTIRGEFAARHRSEILGLIQHLEQREKLLHPLHRIIHIEEKTGSIVIQTTDIHLPREIGEALRRAYQGDLEIIYPEESYSVRVNWTRQS